MNQHVLGQLNDYVDGTLSPDEQEAIDAHLAMCATCRAELESIHLLVRSASKLAPSIQPKHNLWEGIERRIRPERSDRVLEFPGGVTRQQRKTGRMRYAYAVAAVVTIFGFALYWILLSSKPAWNIEVTEGRAIVGSRSVENNGQIRLGETLQTDNTGHATIQVGTIGRVDVEPNTRLQLVQATLTDHRFSLERGTIHATIFAPPRLFFVQTPSALAVDLGCAYTLSVDNMGGSVIQVTSGWVSLMFGGRESIIPAGAMCRTRSGFGPGTPYQDDASPELLASLDSYDFGGGGASALDRVLAEARNIDSITLWHLLFRTAGLERAKVYDRLASLVPPPEGVTREGTLAGDQEMVKRWQKHLNLGFQPWWRFWQ